jgi:hypothetical protein
MVPVLYIPGTVPCMAPGTVPGTEPVSQQTYWQSPGKFISYRVAGNNKTIGCFYLSRNESEELIILPYSKTKKHQYQVPLQCSSCFIQ